MATTTTPLSLRHHTLLLPLPPPPPRLRRRHHPPLPSPRRPLPPLSSSSNPAGPTSSSCPVPHDQQPINEYKTLSASFPFSWAIGPLSPYSTRLALTGLSFGLLVGLPVSWVGALGSVPDPLRVGLGSVSGGLFVVTLAVVRMYLGWAYVGNRLLSATVEYEETGWYDGRIWVKTAEVLARDRLLGSYQVKPVLNRLKNTLVVLALALFACVALLMDLERRQEDSYTLQNEAGGRAVAGVYSYESARLFEPDAFCGKSDVP